MQSAIALNDADCIIHDRMPTRCSAWDIMVHHFFFWV
jgi:hypothetical protein